jgi:sortase A
MRVIERALLTAAIVCLSWYGWRMLDIHREQTNATAQLQRTLDSAGDIALPDGLIGRLEIPRLRLSAPVKTGDDDSVLDFSVGYLPDTPLPWTPGNSAFAAHRDRLFRPLEHIRNGDEIDLTTTHGRLRYRVLKAFVVSPRDVWVLDPIPRVSLTLITCYPFVYVGHAPHRFVVQAEKL